MKNFVEPKMEIMDFVIEDVIATSGDDEGMPTFVGTSCASA